MSNTSCPLVSDPSRIGEYPAKVSAGGGYVWDEVLEYRVWMHPERGAPDECDGNDYFYVFATYEEAMQFSESSVGAERPIALILQREYIAEPSLGVFEHIKKERLTEWPVEFLSRPRRSDNTIPDFFAPGAPPNRLDIIRGLVT